MTRRPAIVVGAGLMGRWHADALSRAGGRVVAVVDRDSGRAVDLARSYPDARVFDDPQEGFGTITDGVVHICTPLATHAPLALAALNAGHHVLVEKPVAHDLASVTAMLDAAVTARRLLCPVHQFLFQPGALQAARTLPSLGPLRHLEAEVCSTGVEHSGGTPDAVALEILPHALSFAARFCAQPITASAWEFRRSAPGELVVGTSVGTAAVTVRLSMSGRPPVNALRLVAERGTITLDLFHGFALVDRTGSSRGMKIARPAFGAARLLAATALNLAARALRKESAYPGLRELVRRFYLAAESNEPSPIPASETRAVAEVWDRLRTRLLQERG